MSITAEDINYLIFRYLQESGMTHTAYAFEIESKVGKADVAHEDIDNGCLIKLLQRGLQYMELEANADSSTFEVLTAADILKAKSTEQLKQVVREKREDRDCSEDQPNPRQFESGACRIVTSEETFRASWNPEGTKLATYGHNNTARICKAGSTLEYKNNEVSLGACPLVHGQMTLSLDSVVVTKLMWAPDGHHVTTGCSDGTICNWSSSGELKQTCKAHSDQMVHLSYSGDGRMLLASSADHPATLWDPQLRSQLGQLDAHDIVNNACWCGANLAMTDSRPEIQLYTATLGSQHQAELEHKRTWSGHSEEVTDLDWAPNQWLLASCSEDRTVRLWGTHQSTELCSLIDDDAGTEKEPVAHVDDTSVCVFRPAGPGSRNPSLGLQLASADGQGFVKIWDCDGGQLISSWQGHKTLVYTVAWSPDGSMLAAGCMNGTLIIWDVLNGTEVKQDNSGEGFFELSWNSDGQRLAGAGKDGVRIWDVRK